MSLDCECLLGRTAEIGNYGGVFIDEPGLSRRGIATFGNEITEKPCCSSIEDARNSDPSCAPRFKLNPGILIQPRRPLQPKEAGDEGGFNGLMRSDTTERILGDPCGPF